VASKPLRFHQAEQEYLTALSWYQERSLTAAMSLEGAFDQALERIREAPYRWPIYFKDFRKFAKNKEAFLQIGQASTGT
jgi:hypothetical protein